MNALSAAAPVAVPELDAEPSADDTFAPEIEGNAGSVNLKVQKGRHATVNDEILLTRDEIAGLIADAVANALKAVGEALV